MMRKRILVSLAMIISVFFVIPFTMGATREGVSQARINKALQTQANIPTCMNRVDIPTSELHWIYVPTNASELHTEENYMYLAGQLITNKVVDGSSCPAGGLSSGGFANACGMSKAQPMVITIQNSLDQAILDAWKNVGVPPVLLKQMIRYESQFWPGVNQGTHYGFTHLTVIGMLNALEWNPSLLQKACSISSGTCTVNEALATTVLQMMDATCASCTNGIDASKAQASVDYLARAVMGYCDQTAQLVFNATGWKSGLVVDYPTIWKLTLMNYNAGATCVFDSVAAAFKVNNGPVTWTDITSKASGKLCQRGVFYANQITAKYYNFPPNQ
ncbi:MAG: hypothetical protein ABFD24_07675 [Anaerolineaceae bacterium]